MLSPRHHKAKAPSVAASCGWSTRAVRHSPSSISASSKVCSKSTRTPILGNYKSEVLFPKDLFGLCPYILNSGWRRKCEKFRIPIQQSYFDLQHPGRSQNIDHSKNQQWNSTSDFEPKLHLSSKRHLGQKRNSKEFPSMRHRDHMVKFFHSAHFCENHTAQLLTGEWLFKITEMGPELVEQLQLVRTPPKSVLKQRVLRSFMCSVSTCLIQACEAQKSRNPSSVPHLNWSREACLQFWLKQIWSFWDRELPGWIIYEYYVNVDIPRYSITTIYNTSTLHLWHTILNKRAWNWMCSNFGDVTSPRETTTIYVERWNPHSTSFHRLLHGARLLHGVLWWKKVSKVSNLGTWDRNDRNSERSGKDAKKKTFKHMLSNSYEIKK